MHVIKHDLKLLTLLLLSKQNIIGICHTSLKDNFSRCVGLATGGGVTEASQRIGDCPLVSILNMFKQSESCFA